MKPEPDLHEHLLFTVTDLKQYSYCQRIFYYHTCLPDIRPVTVKMDAGSAAHEEERRRSARRSMGLPKYSIVRREYDLPVLAPILGLTGQIDEVIWLEDGAVIPVDYKLARKANTNYKHQLAAYALMLEEAMQCEVHTGLLYLIPQRKTETIRITRKLRQDVHQMLDAMRDIATSERMPKPTDRQQKCFDCEFRRFCGDV